MLTLHRQPYGKSALRRSVRLTPETAAALERLAPPGLQASAIALAVRLLGVVVGGDPGEAEDLGEVLAAAVGWETKRLETGLGLVRGAVQRAGKLHEEAMEETNE